MAFLLTDEVCSGKKPTGTTAEKEEKYEKEDHQRIEKEDHQRIIVCGYGSHSDRRVRSSGSRNRRK